MKKYEVQGHHPSYLPEENNWKLVWSDEFDGTELDLTKWDYRLCMMGKRHPAWEDGGVTLDGNSNAVFTCYEKDGRIVSSQLQTGYNFMDEVVTETTFGADQLQWPIGKLKQSKYLKKYGYFECRCRLQQTGGWWSAFWMQSPIIGASLDPGESGTELDIMESFKPGTIASHNAFTGGYGKDMARKVCGSGIKDLDPLAFHTFGMKWDESGYTFYVNGVEDGKITDFVSHRPEFILISTEVKGYRTKNHAHSEESVNSVGDTFLVDYVRVFDVCD